MSLGEIAAASTTDATPEEFKLQFIKLAREGKSMSAATYRMDRIARRHLPVTRRIAVSGLHGDEEWQQFYEHFRIVNYLVQPKWCQEVVTEHLARRFSSMPRPNYGEIFGGSIANPGKIWKSLCSKFQEGIESGKCNSDMGILAISTFNCAMMVLDGIDQELSEVRPLENGEITGLSLGGTDYFGKVTRELSREGFRCLLVGSIFQDLCEAESYPLTDDQKKEQFRRLIIDPELTEDPWVMNTGEGLILLKTVMSHIAEFGESLSEMETQKLISAAIRLDSRTIDRIVKESRKIPAEEPNEIEKNLPASPKAEAFLPRASSRSLKEEFYYFLDSVTESGLSERQKDEIYSFWKRSPKDIRPEISIYLGANGARGLSEFLEDLVQDLKRQEDRRALLVKEDNGESAPVGDTLSAPGDELKVSFVEAEDGASSFDKWLHSIRNPIARQAVLSRLERIRLGHFGDYRRLRIDNEIFELRIHIHSGARVYFTQEGDTIHVLWGGTKDTQRRDIDMAVRLKPFALAKQTENMSA